MTYTEWNDYSHVRIQVVSWPPSEPIGDGMARTLWEIETLTDLGLALGRKIDMERVSQDMTFDAEAAGPRTLRMFCTCDERMEHPYRLGAATLGWRFIDENLARLWMIGDQPRAYYSGFMRQRRQMVEELIPFHRRVWLWLTLIRCEPCLLPSRRPRVAMKSFWG